MLLALLIAAAGPWVGLSAGPAFLHDDGRSGMGSGPLLRLDLGYPLGERAAAEVWLSGAFESAPLETPGDRALAALGAGGRLLVLRLGDEGKFGLWAHAGGGWGVPVAGDGSPGPVGFGGAIFSFQPFIQRFSVGLEADALAYRNGWGAAVMPTLRCSF
jgi:hypothetical protein